MHQHLKLILFWNTSTCFERSFRPSSGVHECTHSNGHVKEILLLLLLASKQTAVSVWQMPVAVCTVLNSLWWTERPSETCRDIGASGWFYYRNILRCTAPWASH